MISNTVWAQDIKSNNTPQNTKPTTSVKKSSTSTKEANTDNPTPKTGIGWVILPSFALAPETGLKLGAYGIMVFRDPETSWAPQPSSLRGELSFTLRNQAKARVRWVQLFQKASWVADLEASATLEPDRFSGIGPNTPTDFELYGAERISSLGYIRRAIGMPRNNMYAGLIYDISGMNITPKAGGMLETQKLPGHQGGVRTGLGAEFYWDARDSAFATRNGTYLNIGVMGFSTLLGGDFDYYRLTLDGRAYKDIGHDNTFAIRGLAIFGGGHIPFYDLQMLGGSSLSRGLYQGRYRDKNMLDMQIEYRSPLFWRLRGNVFASLGTVAPSITAFDIPNDLKWTVGTGLRLLLTDGIYIRLDYALGADSTGLYIDINEAF